MKLYFSYLGFLALGLMTCFSLLFCFSCYKKNEISKALYPECVALRNINFDHVEYVEHTNPFAHRNADISSVSNTPYPAKLEHPVTICQAKPRFLKKVTLKRIIDTLADSYREARDTAKAQGVPDTIKIKIKAKRL